MQIGGDLCQTLVPGPEWNAVDRCRREEMHVKVPCSSSVQAMDGDKEENFFLADRLNLRKAVKQS